MKRFVFVVLVVAGSSAMFGQEIAKNSAPDLLARDTSSSSSSASTQPAQSAASPSFLSVAASTASPASATEALLYTPVPRLSERKPVFHKKIYLSELAAYTAANVLDGITTVRGVRRGFTESSWPQGSSELLGLRPGIARYTATMGALEVGAAFAAFRLEHSQNRYLRLVGHSFLLEGTIDHSMGFASNLNLPGHPQ